ncbi:MAG: neutral/alkaline non-lysosomal ceramidase N-terminal domain-containing protein [Cytophagales bacterium]|nr:neutral/alkaline non-lysosomal ceramidase N-terminal domain-containing protein [Cytophagales bacterium]
MKKFFKITGAVVLIIILFLLWAIRRVDYTPYFETGYYRSTMERLDSLSLNSTGKKGRVYVGFGKRSITPKLHGQEDDPSVGEFREIPLSGYGGRKGAPATGIHDSLFVKTFALKVRDKLMIFVGSDLLIMPPDVSKRTDGLIKNKIGLTRSNIFYSATHTHSSVGAWSEGTVGELFGGAYNPTVVEWLSTKISEAIEAAVDDLKPGRLGIGNFRARAFVRNRLVGEDGEVNDDFLVVLAEQNGGKKAVLGSFDAHATTIGAWNMETSADFPGYWQRKLEKSGFDLSIYFAGSVGSHSYQSKGEKFEKSRYIGEALADSVVKYAQRIYLKDTIELSSMTLKIDYPEFQIRISDGLRLNPVLGKKLFPNVGDVYLQSAKMDSLIWATSPCDFSGETTLMYKNAMHKKGYRAMVTSFNGGYTGYIIPCKYYHLNEYESRLMNWFGPAYNPYVNYLIGDMMDRVSEAN